MVEGDGIATEKENGPDKRILGGSRQVYILKPSRSPWSPFSSADFGGGLLFVPSFHC